MRFLCEPENVMLTTGLRRESTDGVLISIPVPDRPIVIDNIALWGIDCSYSFPFG